MHLVQIRYSLRSLARNPGFACVVILVLSFGIAINTTIFCVIDQVVFNPLPYKNPSGLLMIWESNPSLGEPAGSRVPAAWSNFTEWRNQNQSFQGIEAFERAGYNLTGLAEAEHVTAACATGGYFQLLGINAERGRTFMPEDSKPGHGRVALITHSFGESHFARSDAVGRKVILDGIPYTVVGVLPKDFHLPLFFRGAYEYQPDIWVLMPEIIAPDVSKYRRLFVTARLKQSTSLVQAGAEMTAIAKRLEEIDPQLNKHYSTNLVPLKIENADPDFERSLYVLWIAAFGVLFLGCANLASLMSIRAMNRQKDLAIMKALGAPLSALIANVLIEGSLLAAVASALAVLGSYAGMAWIRATKPGDLAGAERLTLNIGGLLFAMCAFTFCILVFALLPAWLSARQPLNAVLRSSGGMANKGVGRIIRQVLVCGEVAIALALAIGGMLLARSFQKLLEVDTGFHAENVLTARIVLAPPGYANKDSQQHFCDQLLEALRQGPLLESVSLVDNLPLYSIHYTFFEIEARALPGASSPLTADYANVTTDFFRSIGTPLRSGRFFTDQDMQHDAEKVVIVNETMASKFWPNQNPLGAHIRVVIPHRPPEAWRRVIGIVGDFRQFNIDTVPRPEMFWPTRQFSEMTLVVRTPMKSSMALQKVRQAVVKVDKEQPLSDVQTFQQIVDHSVAQRRFNTYLVTGFAGLSIFLALIGVYGLISYAISSREKEIGIRLALGAQRTNIWQFLFFAVFPFTALGILLGLLLSFLLKRLITNLLFGISALDPATYAAVPVAMVFLILVACVRPSLRAARTPPSDVLRQE